VSARQDDPLVVNTSDDRCWRRRGQTPGGHGLYALEGSPQDSEQTLYLIGDLAAFGLRSMSMAYALPVPAGSVDHSSWEDPHDSPLHHRYTKGRDLPEAGGVQ
jgi:hypothetical protein